MGQETKPWWWSEGWSDDVVDVTCVTADGRGGYRAETWRLQDRDGVQWFAGRVLTPAGAVLTGSVHLATNYVIASTGAEAFLTGLLSARPARGRRSRHTALPVLFRRTGRPPRLPARWYPVGVLVHSGGYWWVSNRYVDTKRPFWQRRERAGGKA
jgi:hypothetical protein